MKLLRNDKIFLMVALSVPVLITVGCSILSKNVSKKQEYTQSIESDYKNYLEEHSKVIDILDKKLPSLTGENAVALATVLTISPPKGNELPFSRLNKLIVIGKSENSVYKEKITDNEAEDLKKDTKLKTIWPTRKKQ